MPELLQEGIASIDSTLAEIRRQYGIERRPAPPFAERHE
jgi:hypothetical protein